jgi:hypothetical protein
MPDWRSRPVAGADVVFSGARARGLAVKANGPVDLSFALGRPVLVLSRRHILGLHTHSQRRGWPDGVPSLCAAVTGPSARQLLDERSNGLDIAGMLAAVAEVALIYFR